MKSKTGSIKFGGKVLIVLCVISLLGACASGVSNSVKITEDDVAKYNAMTSQEAVSSLKAALSRARANNLPQYTPSHFGEAEKLYAQAMKALQNNKNKTNIIRNVAKADRFLARANIKKQEVIAELGELLTINENLVTLGVPRVFTKEYDRLKKKLHQLIVKVEKNEANKIEKDRARLLKKLAVLEIKGIKYAALNEANNIKDQAKTLKALKLAPKTYAEAVRVYQQSEENISQSPHDKENVATAKKQAIFAAKHALRVTERVTVLAVKFKKSPESVILEEENRVTAISKAMDHVDLRDQLIDEQIAELVHSLHRIVDEANADNAQYADRITNLEQALKEKTENIAISTNALNKVKIELSERDNLMVKMTADLLSAQGKEKELTALIVRQNAARFESGIEKHEPGKFEDEKKATNTAKTVEVLEGSGAS